MNAHQKELSVYRKRLSKAVRTLYSRMKKPLTEKQEEILDGLEKAEIFEVMHGAMIPHLGIYRLVLRAASKGVAVFFVKDEYEHDWYPEVRAIRMWLRDIHPSRQPSGIVLPIEKDKPVRFVPPPTRKELLALADKIKTRYYHNIRWVREKIGLKLSKRQIREIMTRVDETIALMAKDAELTDNYADFTVRLFIDLLEMTNPDLYDRVFFCSYLDSLEKIFPEDMERLYNAYPQHFWHYCKNLHRNREPVCPKCGEPYVMITPDIVTYQAMTALIRPKARIVGGIKDYSLKADKITKEFYGIEPPERIVVGKPYPTFYGIPEYWGDTRSSIIRVLWEVDARTIGKALIEEAPIIKSKYLSTYKASCGA